MDATETGLSPLGRGEVRVSLRGRTHTVRFEGEHTIHLDGRTLSVTFRKLEDGTTLMALDGKVYRLWAHQTTGDQGRDLCLWLNGKQVSCTVDDHRTLLMQSMRAGGGEQTGLITIKAPMPGLVVKVLVTPGMLVQKGQGLIILEAMKMENELKADRAGRVESVSAVERMPVEKGEHLLVISV